MDNFKAPFDKIDITSDDVIPKGDNLGNMIANEISKTSSNNDKNINKITITPPNTNSNTTYKKCNEFKFSHILL